MTMLLSRKVFVFSSACALLLGTAPQSVAQQVGPNRIIDFHVNLEEFNQSVGGSVKEGGRYTMTIDGRGAYALTAVVTDAAARQVTLTLHRASNEKSQDYRPVETLKAQIGTPVALKSIPLASVVVERIRRVQATATGAVTPVAFAARSPRSWDAVFPVVMFGNCCVKCGNVSVCGCAVTHDCGSCCSDSCCENSPVEGLAVASNVGPAFRRTDTNDCRRPVPNGERLFTRPEPVGKVSLR